MAKGFEVGSVPPGALTGSFDSVVIQDPGGNDTMVLTRTLGGHIAVGWSMNGPLLPFFGGEFTVRAYVEAMGTGPERRLADTVTVAGTSASNYSATLEIGANELPDESVNGAGVYILTVIITHTDSAGVPSALAGFWSDTYFMVRQP